MKPFTSGRSASRFLVRPARPGPAMRLLCHLASVNPERLIDCPRDDWQATARTGLAVLTSFLFTAIVVTGALRVALADTVPLAALVLLAGLMASMIILIDHAIIQSHWFQSGLGFARRAGFAARPGSTGAAISRFVGGAVRLLLSAALAFVLAGFVDLLIFERDILRRMEATHRAANAEVFARATQAVDAETKRTERDVALLDETMAAMRAREASQLGLLAKRDEQTLARVATLRSELAAERARATASALDAVAEENGLRDNDSHSGRKGRGERYGAAQSKKALAEARIKDIEAELARIERGESKVALDSASLSQQIRTDLAALDERRADLVRRRDEAAAKRADAIAAAAQRDPAFAPLHDGLIARLSAMSALIAEPAVLRQALGVKLLIMLIEMGGILTKMLLVSPSLYAVRTAVDFEADASDAVTAAGARIASNRVAASEAEQAESARREERERAESGRRAAATARAGYDALLRDTLAGQAQ